MPLILGVDVGNSGGLAFVTSLGELVAVQPMPVLNDGPKGRPTINAPLLATLISQWAIDRAFVELVGPRPGEAPGGAFSFGRARGCLIEGVLATRGVPTRMLTPSTWKRAIGIPPGRDGAKDLPLFTNQFAISGSSFALSSPMPVSQSFSANRIASGRDGRGSGWVAIHASRASRIGRVTRAVTISESTLGRPLWDFLSTSIDMPKLYRHKRQAATVLEAPSRP